MPLASTTRLGPWSIFKPKSTPVQTGAVLTVCTAPHTPAALRVRARIRAGVVACETHATVSDPSSGETTTAG